MESQSHDGEFLNTLARGLAVLRVFSGEHPKLTLSEVAKRTGISPAAARRCLHTLNELGYVRHQGKYFYLLPEVMSFASAFIESVNLDQLVRPHLQRLRDQSGDSSSLVTLSGHDILYLIHVSTNRMVRLAAGMGTRFPAFATSLGRAIVAFMPPTQRADWLASAELVALTAKTITDATELEANFEQVRALGYSAVADELDYGIVSIAMPIRNPYGKVIAAINCSASTARSSVEEHIEARLPLLRDAVAAIESEVRRHPLLADVLSTPASD